MYVEIIKAEKDKRGLTVNELSNMSNVPASTITHILSGKTANPSFETMKALYNALDLPVDSAASIAALKGSSDDVVALYREILAYREQLLDKKDRWIMRLFLLALAMAFILGFILVWDLTHPGIGFVR